MSKKRDREQVEEEVQKQEPQPAIPDCIWLVQRTPDTLFTDETDDLKPYIKTLATFDEKTALEHVFEQCREMVEQEWCKRGIIDKILVCTIHTEGCDEEGCDEEGFGISEYTPELFKSVKIKPGSGERSGVVVLRHGAQKRIPLKHLHEFIEAFQRGPVPIDPTMDDIDRHIREHGDLQMKFRPHRELTLREIELWLSADTDCWTVKKIPLIK